MGRVERSGRRSIGILLALSLFVSIMAAVPAEVRAEDGTTLRQFTADLPPCDISTGIAFDGQDLLVSCWYTNELYVIDTTDGSLLDTIVVSDLSGIGALAWDRGRSQVWACDYPSESVYLITISGSTATAEFKFTPSDGCIDGVAYNGEDDSLFTSGDVRPTVYHYAVDGTLLDTRDVGGKIGDCNNSGIAIGGGDLFLANNGCQEIWRVANEQDAVPELFASYPARLEDLECDDVTFAGEGKAAIWTKDAYDAVINAFELNPGDCGYGGLASSFVVVALGDSYQSGEGVGNSILDTTAYLDTAYEDGFNYPEQVGDQEDTYTEPFGGNECHRALANYAKINRDLYEPGAPVTLVDETCSGAKIEPGSQPPIVGTVGGGVAADSQIAQALDRLALEGISAEEVDLVTVGMGGNDAGFGDIVTACVAPTLVRKLLDEYPDPPRDIKLLAQLLVHCSTLDAFLLNTGPLIDALQPKEEWGQQQLLTVFPNARILQLNYPNPLPSANDVKDWCGGIRPGDLQYAREKVRAIDDAIAASISSTGDLRLDLVDVEHAFGRNPLCPQDGSQVLVNSFVEANVDREIQRLLNLTPDGDPIARQKLDTLATEWEEYRACLITHLNPLDGGADCDPGPEWDDVVAAFNSLAEHLQREQPTIFANLIEPPGPDAESENVRLDRARGLFHPNMVGFEILACNVRAGYASQDASGCLSDPDLVFDTINGEETGLSPIDVIIDEILDVIFNGFESNTPVHITFHSEEIDLGTVTADANGQIDTSIQIPDTTPGVHTIRFAGTAADGVQLVKEIKVKVPGDPVPGEPYGVYLCCFPAGTAEDGIIEFVDVTFGGFTFTVVPDIEGGIFFEIPLPDASVDITIEAVSQLTGEQVTEQVTVGGGMSRTWGRNSQGQLGNGTTNDSSTPVDVSDLAGIATVGAGGEHSLAALSDGTAWAWGQNANGQLGDGTLTDRTTPVQVSGLSGIIEVDGGLAHSLALRDDGTVWAWGLNQNGQLGNGTTTDSTTPVQTSGLSGVVAIAAGGDHSIALKSDGTVWAWGKNSDGQLGDGSKKKSSVPVQVSDLTGVVAIAAGDAHSLSVKSDGTVWVWGDNFYGQLGDGTTRDRNTPVQVTSLTGAEAVAGGSFHSLAVKSDGTVWAWGRNVFGQLGDGTTTDRATPVQTSNLSTAADISAGAHHSLAAQEDGTVWAWGLNLYGQLGDGTTTNRATPVQASEVSGIEEVSAGAFHSVTVD